MIAFPSINQREVVLRAFQGYAPSLLDQVALRLIKPRDRFSAEELISSCMSTLSDVPLVDRRLEDLAGPSRTLLSLIGRSRQPLWSFGNLIELCYALQHEDPMATVVDLLTAGMLFPVSASRDLAEFDSWLTQTPAPCLLLAHTLGAERARLVELDLGETIESVSTAQGVVEADGLEWPLRLSALWQQVSSASLRVTQQGDFFKRDLQRLQTDPLLNAAPADSMGTVIDPGFLAVALAIPIQILNQGDDELLAGSLPAFWEDGLDVTLESIWKALLGTQQWRPTGWLSEPAPGNPYPSAVLLSLMLLATLPQGEWATVDAIEQWVASRHPYWRTDEEESVPGLRDFILGLAHQMRMVRYGKDDKGATVVQLTEQGQWQFGLTREAPLVATFSQSLLVQPNLEIVAYRQGLTPRLINRLAGFATWKSLGAACALQLEPESVYRALEQGESFESIVQVMEQHGSLALPDAVVSSLQTWARKRDRIRVYPSAILLEFGTPEELNDALSRDLSAIRISDRLALVAGEDDLDFRHFRLISTRDYSARPEQCAMLEEDGITLIIDLKRSDLMVEWELARFARPLNDGLPDQRRYRLTPTSMAKAREGGLTTVDLESWFQKRAGEPLSPAGYLLLNAAEAPPLTLQEHLVLEVDAEELADGLMQWPPTKALIQTRLGPKALVARQEDAPALRDFLDQLGIQIKAIELTTEEETET